MIFPILLATTLVAGPSPAAGVPTLASSTLSPDQLHPGQKAVVKTVFEGSRVEEFDAEIIGVLRGGRTQGDMILGRALSERVVKTGVAQGMSGSPVYVEGKLIGALSSGWSFSREPIFGITPIGEMLAVLDQPSVGSSDGTAGPTGVEVSGLSSGIRFGEFRWDDPPGDRESQRDRDTDGAGPPSEGSARSRDGASEAYGTSTGLARLPLPMACAGLNPSAFEYLRRRLEPFGFAAVPGGRTTASGPPAQALEPGSAVAIDIMRGDLQLSAIGTLTYRDGDRVLLFGHPFFQSGEVRLPLATAEITTVVSSQFFSFKLGVRARSAGVVTQDRRTAVAGRLGPEPRMLPVAVGVLSAGGASRAFHFESIEDRALAPSLIGIAALNSLLESGGLSTNQTLRWTLRLHRKGLPPLVLSDVEAGESPAVDLATGIAAPLGFLFNNPYRRLSLDSVAVTVEKASGRQQWTLRSVRLLETAVRPGGRAHIRCEVERWRGTRETRDLAFVVPEEVPEGRYTLWLGGGPELSRYEATHLPGRYRPTSLEDAWQRLAATRSSDGVYAALFARAPEVTIEGRDYPELPISALALLSSEQSAGDRGRRGDLAKLDEQRIPLGGLVRGELQVSITVDAKAP